MKQSTRRALKIYFRSVFYTTLCCLILCAAGAYFYWKNQPEAAGGGLEVPKDPAAQSLAPKNDKPLQMAVLIKSEYDRRLLETVLVRFEKPEKKLLLFALPAQAVLAEQTAGEHYTAGEAAQLVQSVEKEAGVTIPWHMDFETDSLYWLTKTTGGVVYRLEKDISFYEPATSRSFVAQKGNNRFNGNEAAKLIEYTLNEELTEGSAVCAELVKAYFEQNCMQTPSHSFASITNEGFTALIDRVKTNASAFDYDPYIKQINDFFAQGFSVEILPTRGTYNQTSGRYFLSMETLEHLKNSFGR